MRTKQYYVYILASKRNGTLYTGVTDNLMKRVWQHKNKLADGFTKKYGVDKLVYYEVTNDIRSAIQREKQIKKWNRKWKIELIEKNNPEWRDLYENFFIADRISIISYDRCVPDNKKKNLDSRLRGNDKSVNNRKDA